MRFQVGGQELAVSDAFWEALHGPKPGEWFSCDGCSWSPDAYRTLTGKVFKLWPACVIHDYHYRTDSLRLSLDSNLGLGRYLSIPGDAAGRRTADAAFRGNLQALIRLQGGSAARQRSLSWLYWGRVRIWGARSFRHWAPGQEPLTWWRRVKEAYGCPAR